eukprot:366844-Amphidinium_carterae.1
MRHKETVGVNPRRRVTLHEGLVTGHGGEVAAVEPDGHVHTAVVSCFGAANLWREALAALSSMQAAGARAHYTCVPR